MIYIDQVHYATDSHGCTVIKSLKWTETLSELATNESTKQVIIDFINKNPNSVKTKFLRNGNWTVGEDVRVVNNSYLRTDANNTAEDNLENLIKY